MGQLTRHGPCLVQHRVGGTHTVEITPLQRFVATDGAAGEQQLTRTALAHDTRQHVAGTHIAACQTHTVEQESGLAARSAQAQVGRHGHDGTGTGTHTVNRGHDGLRAVAHGLDQVASHTREHQQLRGLQANQRADDFVHVTTGTKVVTGPNDHHGLHVVGIPQALEQITQLGVGRKGQRVLAFGAVECDGAHTVTHLPQEVFRLIVGTGLVVACREVGVHCSGNGCAGVHFLLTFLAAFLATGSVSVVVPRAASTPRICPSNS